MTANSQRAIVNCLHMLMDFCPEVIEAIYNSYDGLHSGAVLLGDVEEEQIQLMSSALISLAARVATQLEQGDLRFLQIKGEYGYLVIMLGEQGTLIVQANKQAKLGLVFSEMGRALKGMEAALK